VISALAAAAALTAALAADADASADKNTNIWGGIDLGTRRHIALFAGTDIAGFKDAAALLPTGDVVVFGAACGVCLGIGRD
jgi:hypothetical protein